MTYDDYKEMMDGFKFNQKLYAIYDMRVNPPGFNFAEFLLMAEFLRQKIHARWYKPPVEMVVVLVYGGDGTRMARVGEGMPYSQEYGEMVVKNLMVPMVKLCPSVSCIVSMDAEEAHKRFPYAKERWNELGLVKHHDRSGSFGLGCHTAGVEQIFYLLHKDNLKDCKFVADKSARPIGDNVITMTLRDAPHMPERNNNKLEWMQAKEYFEELGYEVIVLRENEPLNERAALYAQAKLNIGSFGGPVTLLMGLDAPYLLMKPNVGTAVVLPKGGQIPNSRQDQRVAWGEDNSGADTAEVMIYEANKILQNRGIECHYLQ